LAIGEQNVVALELAIEEKNVDPFEFAIKEQNAIRIKELRVDETSNQCKLKLDMVIMSNPSDEIPPKTNWEFQLRSGRLDYF
jgi:hypothetical protein